MRHSKHGPADQCRAMMFHGDSQVKRPQVLLALQTGKAGAGAEESIRAYPPYRGNFGSCCAALTPGAHVGHSHLLLLRWIPAQTREALRTAFSRGAGRGSRGWAVSAPACARSPKWQTQSPPREQWHLLLVYPFPCPPCSHVALDAHHQLCSLHHCSAKW